jgi:drug/metabolite transporter (DMT)-like permease
MKNIWPAVVVFAVSIASLSLGNILLKLGMERYAEMAGAGAGGWPAWLKVPQLLAGVGLMLVQFGCTLTLFKWGWDATVVIPVMGLSYVAMGFLGRWWLGEPVNAMRWLGICLIILGVFFVARSGAATNLPASVR